MMNPIKIFIDNSKLSNPVFHVVFWIFITIILNLFFGRKWGNELQAYYFISMLLPILIGTSYFFNYFLVPRYLLKRKYFWFTLYFFYTLVISLYLEMIVLTFSFIYLANFELEQMAANSRDALLLAAVMYLVVFFGSFLLMVQQFFENKKELERLKNEKEKMDDPYLELLSNRKLTRISFKNIDYIESLADYILVHTSDGLEIKSKVKISAVENLLPETFLRIHRSFIVNSAKITSFNANKLEIGLVELNIGRSYKKHVVSFLKVI